jgi:hypothetical protein
MAPLVVLYSTAYREWAKAVDSQIKTIKNISDSPIFGIHYWKDEVLVSPSTPSRRVAPSEPPDQIKFWPYRCSISEQQIEVSAITKGGNFQPLICNILSTRIALENAESLWMDLYGAEMPDDQPILRMRPDIFIEYLPDVTPEENCYITNWPRLHGRNWNPQSPEAGDNFCLTTKKVMKKLLSIDLSKIENMAESLRGQGRIIGWTEHYLHMVLEHLNINILQFENIHYSIVRETIIERAA